MRGRHRPRAGEAHRDDEGPSNEILGNVQQRRSTQYPFGIIVLSVDGTGKGTGTLSPICKIKFNKKDELEIENYGKKPLRLANARIEKSGKSE